MTAEIVALFDEPWEQSVLRLAQALQRMREHSNPGQRTVAERNAFVVAKRQLVLLLNDPPA